MNVIDNIAWHTLSGAHARYTRGTDEARRYVPGFSPIVGFANAEQPKLESLRPHSEPGEHLYCGGWSGPVPRGWQVHDESILLKMVWDAPIPAVGKGLAVTRLGNEHISQMRELTSITKPGPFGPRALELGEHVGVFEGQCLIAMAGERMIAGGFREICSVCTLAEFQGRGLAKRLVEALIQRQMQRNERPFLHVMEDNAGARRLYERMGFRLYQATVARIVSWSE